jgi:hypothetical protein
VFLLGQLDPIFFFILVNPSPVKKRVHFVSKKTYNKKGPLQNSISDQAEPVSAAVNIIFRARLKLIF